MDSEQLRLLMQGKAKERAKSKMELDLEKEIDAYANGLVLEEDPNKYALESLELKRQKLKNSLLNELQLPETMQYADRAIGLLIAKGEECLTAEENEDLLSYLADLATDYGENKALTHLVIDEASTASIEKIAFHEFDETHYENALSLFYFLSLLNPHRAEFWFRLGIAAQKSGHHSIALRAYSAASSIDPQNIGARLFSAEIHLEDGHKSEAKAELVHAKDLVKTGHVDAMWLDLLSLIGDKL